MRSLIKDEMERQGLSVSTLSETILVNKGTLSKMLNNKQPLHIDAVDAITELLGKPSGWLYKEYSQGECFIAERGPVGKRIKPFLVRCAEVGRLNEMNELMCRLMENPEEGCQIIFETANEQYHLRKFHIADHFYSFLVENDPYTQSDRYYVSLYRRFCMVVKSEESRRVAVIRFEPYVERIPPNVRLDAYRSLIYLNADFENWTDVEKYALKLHELAGTVAKLRSRSRKEDCEPFKPDAPLVFYYGYGYLMRSIALQKQRRYHEARLLIPGYADLRDFPRTLAEEVFARKWVRKFGEWASRNQLHLDVFLGEKGSLAEHVQIFREDYALYMERGEKEMAESELIPALLTLMEASTVNPYDIGDIIKEFRPVLRSCTPTNVTHRKSQYKITRYMALYCAQAGNYEAGIDDAIESIHLALRLDDSIHFKESIMLFTRFASFATPRQLDEYNNVLIGGFLHEKASSSSSPVFRFNSDSVTAHDVG